MPSTMATITEGVPEDEVVTSYNMHVRTVLALSSIQQRTITTGISEVLGIDEEETRADTPPTRTRSS